MRIPDTCLEHLMHHGYVVVPGLLSPAEIAACRQEVAEYLPSADEIAQHPHRYRKLDRFALFPFEGDALNHVTVHPDLLDFLERVHGTPELRLGESILQGKYGKRSGAGADQLLHNDAWGKNSLVYPREDGIFRHTFAIVYYSDVTEDLAPTYVISQQRTKDVPLLTESGETARSREDYPEIYAMEEPVLASAGSALIFSASTFHRGSAIRAEIGERYAHFITYHAAAATWMESQNWPSAPPKPNSQSMQRFLESISPRQREVLGFPPVGHEYWNETTLRGVGERYPGMDMTPYRHGLAGRDRDGAVQAGNRT